MKIEERSVSTTMWNNGDLDDLIFDGCDAQPSER